MTDPIDLESIKAMNNEELLDELALSEEQHHLAVAQREYVYADIMYMRIDMIESILKERGIPI